MDRLLRRYVGREQMGLVLQDKYGIAYQKSMDNILNYDEEYCKTFNKYSDKKMSDTINQIRVDFIKKYCSDSGTLVDVGAGNCAFLKYAKTKFDDRIYGYDINPGTVKILKKFRFFTEDLTGHSVYTFFDSLEHIPNPENYLKRIPENSYLITSLPVFKDFDEIWHSRHYLPGEHLYYFLRNGVKYYLGLYGFTFLGESDAEMKAGRSNSVLFAFRKSGLTYGRLLELYSEMHEKFYGSSAHLYFDIIARIVKKLNPKSILDYGCGRSDLATYFWADGARRIQKYDPAINQYKQMPDGVFDLVLCTDVLEHIPMRYIDQVLQEIRHKSQKAIFTISLRLARSTLPDGTNAHVSLLTEQEWVDWIQDYFGIAKVIPSGYDHILMIRTF